MQTAEVLCGGLQESKRELQAIIIVTFFLISWVRNLRNSLTMSRNIMLSSITTYLHSAHYIIYRTHSVFRSYLYVLWLQVWWQCHYVYCGMRGVSLLSIILWTAVDQLFLLRRKSGDTGSGHVRNAVLWRFPNVLKPGNVPAAGYARFTRDTSNLNGCDCGVGGLGGGGVVCCYLRVLSFAPHDLHNTCAGNERYRPRENSRASNFLYGGRRDLRIYARTCSV